MINRNNKREHGFFDPETGSGKDLGTWPACDHAGCRHSHNYERGSLFGGKPGVGPRTRAVSGVFGVTYFAPDAMGMACVVLHLCAEHSADVDGTQLDIC